MNRNFIFKLQCLTIDAKFDFIDGDHIKIVRELLEHEIPFKIKNYQIFNEKFLKNYANGEEIFSENVLKFIFESDIKNESKDIREIMAIANLENSQQEFNTLRTTDPNFEKEENLLPNKDESLTTQPRLNISASLDNKFSGNVLEHNQIEMTIDEYLNYKGEINLYLSQINLINRENINNILKYQNLSEIFNKEFSRINIWHSYKPTLSKFHYDAYENFLFLIKGKKIFTIAPNNSSLIKPAKIGENSGNQYDRVNYKRMTPKLIEKKAEFYQELTSILEAGHIPAENIYISLIKKISKYFLMEIELNENEIIYIPEGWWHQVETFGDDNLAFNFWWEKSNILLNNNKEIFLIKQSLHKLVEKKIKSLYRINLRKNEYKKFKLRHLKKLINENKNDSLIKILFSGGKNSTSELDFNFLGICLVYAQFENQKDSSENKIFFQKFWALIEEKNLTEKFMKNINSMKRKIALDIIDNQIKNCI